MLRTNDVGFISSLHGRERRAQRNIAVRDLKAAVKYGTKEKSSICDPKTGRPRWIYRYQDITYVTDETSTIEVTSWALEIPMEKISIPEKILVKLGEAQRRVQENPHLITSHTVLVVDMSRSMEKSDMNGHRTRYRGVYCSLAEELIASRLYNVDTNQVGGQDLNYTDVVTLIEMRDVPTIVFELMPISWLMYNRMIDLAAAGSARSHGNYYPSFETAFNCLERTSRHLEHCAMCLYFFSDGRPSDSSTNCVGMFPFDLYQLITSECAKYGSRLTFSAVGYGTDESDFVIMKEMVLRAKLSRAEATFDLNFGSSDMISRTITKTVESLTSTRTSLSRLNDHNSHLLSRERTDMTKQAYKHEVEFSPDDYHLYIHNKHGCITDRIMTARNDKTQFKHPDAVGFAV